jgi:hypothetical protein
MTFFFGEVSRGFCALRRVPGFDVDFPGERDFASIRVGQIVTAEASQQEAT